MVRQFTARRYMLAAILTFLIFVLGIMLGLVIEGKRLQYYQNLDKIQRLDYSSLQLQYAYIDQLGAEGNCPAFLKTFDESVKSLEAARIRLEGYSRETAINKNDFDFLRRNYILAQMRYWLFARQAKNLCGQDVVTIIYFFSSKKECDDCDEQSFVLTYLKKKFGDRLLNFAFDESYENEPVVTILKEAYGIDSYPAIIVEGKKYEGLLRSDELLGIICNLYKDPPEDCHGVEAVNVTR